jgi:hypothetical protein
MEFFWQNYIKSRKPVCSYHDQKFIIDIILLLYRGKQIWFGKLKSVVVMVLLIMLVVCVYFVPANLKLFHRVSQ